MSKKYFWAAIPQCDNLWSIIDQWIPDPPCQTEISQLQLTFIIQKQIGELEISVEDIIIVEITDCFKELKHQTFYLCKVQV